VPDIRPLPGIRYNPDVIEDLSRVIAPPYDVIDPPQHAELLAVHPNNSVKLILGSEPGQTGDYQAGAQTMEEWLAEGILARDETPLYYLVEDTFQLPGEDSPRHRWGIICRVRLEPLDSGRIHPHERTHKGPKEDRLSLMRAYKSNLSQVFSLFDGDSAVVKEALEGTFASEPVMDITDYEGLGRKMWLIEEPPIIHAISTLLSDRDLYIADGHHRYETALAYAEEKRAADPNPSPDKDYNFIMMTLMGMEDPGLAILPTHRLMYGFDNFDFDAVMSCLGKAFDIVPAEVETVELFKAGSPPGQLEGRGFHLYNPADGAFYQLTLSGDFDLAVEMPDLSRPVRELDVSLAEQILMIRCLGLTADQISHKEHLEYYKDLGEAMERAGDDGQLLVIMHSTAMKDLVAVTRARERMPQKSTYFYPKLLTGLVYYKHSD
jgi:uncharacterized protein (DUF1015 family)